MMSAKLIGKRLTISAELKEQCPEDLTLRTTHPVLENWVG